MIRTSFFITQSSSSSGKCQPSINQELRWHARPSSRTLGVLVITGVRVAVSVIPSSTPRASASVGDPIIIGIGSTFLIITAVVIVIIGTTLRVTGGRGVVSGSDTNETFSPRVRVGSTVPILADRVLVVTALILLSIVLSVGALWRRVAPKSSPLVVVKAGILATNLATGVLIVAALIGLKDTFFVISAERSMDLVTPSSGIVMPWIICTSLADRGIRVIAAIVLSITVLGIDTIRLDAHVSRVTKLRGLSAPIHAHVVTVWIPAALIDAMRIILAVRARRGCRDIVRIRWRMIKLTTNIESLSALAAPRRARRAVIRGKNMMLNLPKEKQRRTRQRVLVVGTTAGTALPGTPAPHAKAFDRCFFNSSSPQRPYRFLLVV